MENSYKTLFQEGSDEFSVKKSRFIAYARSVKCEEAALDYIGDIKKKYKDATHHCYAYVIGSQSGIMRYQDDGEPTGTAGQPIMKIIQSKELVDVCVVVVRYFGGTLLGTGGLARAYSQAALLAIEAAGLVMMEPTAKLSAFIPYALWDKIQYNLHQLPVHLDQIEYTHQVEASFDVRLIDLEQVKKTINDSSDGNVKCILIDNYYHGWPSA